MKVLITCFVIIVTVGAITVPPSWHRPPPRTGNTRPHRPNRNTPYHTPRTTRTTSRPISTSKLPQTSQSDWIPVPPPVFSQQKHYFTPETTTKRPKSHANKNIPHSPITGSRIHLAPKYTPGPDHYLEHSSHHYLTPEEPIKSTFNSPISEHEIPKDIPTRPIYPGEGQWAKTRKHKPHISPHNQPQKIQNSEEEEPEGYDIFERGQERFRVAQNKYKLPSTKKEDYKEEKVEDDFVPQKIYAQVRKTETKKHLPRSQINSEEENADRLREVIKDSKIQTVYTEEGYEDSAYDHAGKEKKAESQEGYIRKAEQGESSGRKNNNRKRGQYSQKHGHNRGHIKHRRTNNRDEVSKIHNYDDTEGYDSVKKNVEKEVSDSETGETTNQAFNIPQNSKALHTTKQQKIEIKTAMRNGDDINMEIHTEVKFINGSDKRKHKFVKIIPSYQRVIEPDENIYDSSELDAESSEIVTHKRVKRYDRNKLSQMYIRKRPNYYWKRKKTRTTNQKGDTKIRTKRYTLDFPDIDVPTVKLKSIKSSLKSKHMEEKKYPYLKVDSKLLNENSPLRYAESLENIPPKTQDDMAFYKSRSRTKCPEVPDDIDPIPDRIKRSDDGPRLEGLGDKIDCLKIKYFGEDPLDSPIFKEESVKIVVPQFFKKITNKHGSTPDDEIDLPKKSIKRHIKTFNPIFVEEEDTNTTTNPINVQRDAVLKPPYTLQELSKRNKTGPNSIYDQINLLATQNDNKYENKEEPKFVIVYENQSAESNSMQRDQEVEDKINSINITNGYFVPQLSEIISDLNIYSEELPSNEIINLVPENFTEYDLLLPNEGQTNREENTNLPTQEALKDYRYFSQYATKFKPSMKGSFKVETQPKFSSFIFDISKYLPQIKKPKIISEVQYKDDIKPNEQLNVYSDVLRAINISTQEEIASESSQPITVKLQVNNSTRNPKRKIRIKTTTTNPIVDLLTRSEESAASNIYNSFTKTNLDSKDNTSPQIFPTDVPSLPKTLPERIRTMINQYTNPLVINVPESNQDSSEISGLAPPPSSTIRYRTIPFPFQQTKLILRPINRNPRTNYFFITGLRPPQKKTRVTNYNDFNIVKRNKRHLSMEQEEDLFTAESNLEEMRVRRPMYTEIVRSRAPVKSNDEDEEEEEDILPRKRTYDIKPRPSTTTERIEDYEELVVEKPLKAPPIYEKPTGLPDYIKLIDNLHDYRFVNNITTTLPEYATTTVNPRAKTTTAKTQTTAESVNKGVPAFLQIITALHDTRKENDPVTEAQEEIQEEEVPSEPVQNSNPYISSAYTRNEDDNEEDIQTHIRNLSNKFRTSIDTSKYKTIERAPIVLRHNFSSRYNAEDEKLPLERIFTTKMPAMFTTTIRNEEKELVLRREHSPEIKEITEDEPVSSTTTATRRRGVPRRRPTTPRSVETTTRYTPPIVRRRRPQKIQSSTETPTTTPPRRRLRQRLEPQTSIKNYVSEIPPNHKKEYVPVTELARNGELREEYKRPNDINKNTWKKLYDRRILNHRPDQESTENDKKEEVEIIATIKNPEMRHGGNYRREENYEETTSRNRFIRRRPSINRSIERTTQKEDIEEDEEEDKEQEESTVHKPKIIKDPSKRMYFYAKI